MVDTDQQNQKPSKAIVERPVEIEAVEKDGQVADNPEPELSEEEQKKLAAEAKKKSAQKALDETRKALRPGDTVKVFTKVKEGDKERIQGFQGIVISKRGRGISKTFTVRKISVGGIGVERIWPLYSPVITKIDIIQPSVSRRSKLYYLRHRIGKAAMDTSK